MISSYSEGVHRERKITFAFVKNAQLIDKIKEYRSYIDSISAEMLAAGDSVITVVYYKTPCDSIEQFVLSADASPDVIKDEIPYFVPVRVDSKDVFFSIPYHRGDHRVMNDIEVSTSKYEEFMRDYFPKAYSSYKRYGYVYPQILYEPPLYFLTFVNGALIDAQLERGLPEDKIFIKSLGTWL